MEVGRFGISKSDGWKIKIGKYLRFIIIVIIIINCFSVYSNNNNNNCCYCFRLSTKNAILMGINMVFPTGSIIDVEKGSTITTTANNNKKIKKLLLLLYLLDHDSDEEFDEVLGYNFVNCTTLFAAYVYVNSGIITTIKINIIKLKLIIINIFIIISR